MFLYQLQPSFNNLDVDAKALTGPSVFQDLGNPRPEPVQKSQLGARNPQASQNFYRDSHQGQHVDQVGRLYRSSS